MQTEIVSGPPGISRALALLRAGEVVALPTETVYGLAADALNAKLAAKIFAAKKRPRFDPLIVHLPTREWLEQIAVSTSELVNALTENFWPGPLTLLLPKRSAIPDIVTAGLETVAVRMSAHDVFSQVIAEFGAPLAAPSANRFGRLSPTIAAHVFEELAGRIPLIVDGGATTHGVESTILRVIGKNVEILRPGPITIEQLREFAPVSASPLSAGVLAPGQLLSHYAPRTPLLFVEKLAAYSPAKGKTVGALSFRPFGPPFPTEDGGESLAPSGFSGFALVRCLSAEGNLIQAAANLFRMLRELDSANLDLIVAEKVPAKGVGLAINERLQRASGNAENEQTTSGAAKTWLVSPPIS